MLLLLVPLVFFGITLFGHVTHWVIHQPWAGRFAKAHMAHHERLYPVNDFLSDTYRKAGKDSTVWIFAVLSLPVLALPVIAHLLGWIGLFTMTCVIAEMLFLGWLHDYLHDAFHIRDHFLKRLPFVKGLMGRLTELHRLHHVDMSKNFGIFFFMWDKVFKTLKRS